MLIGKSEGKKPLERPGRRWESNIKTSLRETDCGNVTWIELPQDRTKRIIMSRHQNTGKKSQFTDG
jgi:hypothetical protein